MLNKSQVSAIVLSLSAATIGSGCLDCRRGTSEVTGTVTAEHGDPYTDRQKVINALSANHDSAVNVNLNNLNFPPPGAYNFTVKADDTHTYVVQVYGGASERSIAALVEEGSRVKIKVRPGDPDGANVNGSVIKLWSDDQLSIEPASSAVTSSSPSKNTSL